VSQKISKLIRKFSRATGRDPASVNQWYEALSTPQREQATAVMRKHVGKPEKK
jgi:hypothetical protein